MEQDDFKFLYWVKVLPAKGKPSALYFLQQPENRFKLFTTDKAGFLSEISQSEVEELDFSVATGELKIKQGANYISTNLDGRYRQSKQIEDVVNAEPTVLDAWNMSTTRGAFIDYVLWDGDNQRSGRIIATWNESGCTATEYGSPILGSMNVKLSIEEHAGYAEFTIESSVNGLGVRALITII